MNEIARRTVLYELPGTDDVIVRGELPYRDGVTFDLYLPPGAERPPVVVLVAGYPDPGFRQFVGCRFKEMGSTTSWARLIAAWGLAAIAYGNEQPAADLDAMLEHVGANAESLGVDGDRIGLWASSGNGPLALSALVRNPSLRCAALCYPYAIDVDGSTIVAEASKQFHFTAPPAEALPRVPLFLARAGGDTTPRLNEALDRFAAAALARDLPLTLVNWPGAPHAFDMFAGGPGTASLVTQVLAFLQRHL